RPGRPLVQGCAVRRASAFRCSVRSGDSERDVAVVAAAAELGDVIGTDRRRLLVAAGFEARTAACTATTLTAAAADEAHVLGDDLGAPALLAFLVLPLPRAQRALDQHGAALRQVLLRQVGLLAEEHDRMPLGLVLPAALPVGTPLVRRDAQVRDRGAALRVPHLGILAEVAQQDDAIEAAHDHAPWRSGGPVRGPVAVRWRGQCRACRGALEARFGCEFAGFGGPARA